MGDESFLCYVILADNSGLTRGPELNLSRIITGAYQYLSCVCACVCEGSVSAYGRTVSVCVGGGGCACFTFPREV